MGRCHCLALRPIGLPLAECFKTMFPDLQESFLPRCADTYQGIFNEFFYLLISQSARFVLHVFALIE